MVYRLLIEVDYSIIDYEYPGLLLKWEMPRGSTISLMYYITNISDSYFSGIIRDLTISFNETAFGASSMMRDNTPLNIRTLPPGQKVNFYQRSIRMFTEGKGWFRVVIEAADGQQIEYFNSAEGPSIGTTQWQFGFDVINRENLEIIKILKEINAKIH